MDIWKQNMSWEEIIKGGDISTCIFFLIYHLTISPLYRTSRLLQFYYMFGPALEIRQTYEVVATLEWLQYSLAFCDMKMTATFQHAPQN
jgi:hypothetical protein